MDGERAKALTAEEEVFWRAHGFQDESVTRMWATLDAERARADAADKRAEAIRAKLVEICEDASEGDMEWLSLLKEKSERVSRLEAEAGALRDALDYTTRALRLVLAGLPCTFVGEALAASDSALAPGAGERVAEVLRAAREWVEAFRNRHRSNATPDDFKRLDAAYAALTFAVDALDAERGAK